MARNKPYQYISGDTPVSVAGQFGITPQQLIDANPSGYPFTTGQNILIPNSQGPGNFGLLGNINAGVNAAVNFAQNTAIPAYMNIERNKVDMYRRGWNTYKNTVSNISQNTPNQVYGTLGVVAPGTALSLMNSQQPGAMGGGGGSIRPAVTVQQLISQGVPPSVAAQMAGNATSTNFTGSNSFTSGAGGVNLQPGMNNNQFVMGLAERLVTRPEEFDTLPQSAQDAIRQSIGGGAPAADPANSPGGRFIQVGEVRWERNKNGRMVKVQYTGGGSWRNKRVVGGGRGQHKALMQSKQQTAVDPGNSNIPSFGVVNFNAGAG